MIAASIAEERAAPPQDNYDKCIGNLARAGLAFHHPERETPISQAEMTAEADGLPFAYELPSMRPSSGQSD